MRRLATGLLFLCILLPAFAQEDIDSLFDDPEAGIIEEEPEDTVDVDALTEQEEPSFSGSATAEAGLSLGLRDWTVTGNFSDDFLYSPYYALGSSVRFDVRPTSATRFFVSLSVSAPSAGSVGLGSISINELFIDYTIVDTFFFRVGRQGMTWGNGQLFNPANLISPVSGAISVRGFAPLSGGGLTLVAIAQDGYFSDPELPGIAEVGVAGQLEWNLSPLSGTLSGFYQAEEGFRTAATIKMPVAGADVSVDGVVDWDVSAFDNTYTVLLATFWEGTDIGLQVVAEYLFESNRLPDGLGSTVGLGVLATDLLSTWNPGLRWFHALHDGSGEVILGADGPVAESLRVSVGMPIAYGPAGTTYRQDTEDPLGRVLSFILRVSLSLSF